MRIVLDTNTVVAGIFWDGPPRRILRSARSQAVTFCTSAALIEELAEVLVRDKFARHLRAAQRSAYEVLEEYLGLTELVLTAPLPAPICRDPEDDQVLACAVAAKAGLIVTGDHDLLVLKEYEGTSIVRPAEALLRLAAGGA